MKLTMLKYILFLLSEAAMNLVAGEKEHISLEMQDNGVEVFFGRTGLSADENLEETDRDSTLVVTDDPPTFDRLYGEGFYMVIYYHEGNRDQNFPGAAYGVEDLPAVAYESYEKAFRRLAGIPWDILETERMKVRETIPEDVDEFYRIYSDPSITYFMENLYADREMEIEYVKAYAKQVYAFYGFGLWTVLDKESGWVIGRAGLNVREGYDLPELGFVIDVDHQGRGYAFEVCTAVLDYAENVLEFDAVQAFVDKNNLVSIRLLEKLGFAFAGEAMAKRRYQLYIKRFMNSGQSGGNG